MNGRDPEDYHEMRSLMLRLDDACDDALEILRRIEPTISDQLLRFDVRKAIEQLEEAPK